jgi:hypothetical protein
MTEIDERKPSRCIYGKQSPPEASAVRSLFRVLAQRYDDLLLGSVKELAVGHVGKIKKRTFSRRSQARQIAGLFSLPQQFLLVFLLGYHGRIANFFLDFEQAPGLAGELHLLKDRFDKLAQHFWL